MKITQAGECLRRRLAKRQQVERGNQRGHEEQVIYFHSFMTAYWRVTWISCHSVPKRREPKVTMIRRISFKEKGGSELPLLPPFTLINCSTPGAAANRPPIRPGSSLTNRKRDIGNEHICFRPVSGRNRQKVREIFRPPGEKAHRPRKWPRSKEFDRSNRATPCPSPRCSPNTPFHPGARFVFLLFNPSACPPAQPSRPPPPAAAKPPPPA